MIAGALLPKTSAGFTLLELLVVLAVFGFILAILGNGVRFASRAVHSADRQAAMHDDLDPVQAAIRQLIGDGRVVEGSSDEVSFVGPMPEALDLHGQFEISLLLSDDRLVARWRPLRPDSAGDDDPSDPRSGEAELARGIESLAFAYYATGADAKPGWHSSSPRHSATPRLVRIDVTLAPGDPRHWPDLVVAPGVDAPPPGAS
jgi:general secretion pathway protein J